MLFNQTFLGSVSDDPVLALLDAIRIYHEYLVIFSNMNELTDDEINAGLETYALVTSIANGYDIQLHAGTHAVEQNSNPQSIHVAISMFLASVKEQYEGHISAKKLEALKRQFQSSLGIQFAYEFSQGDLEQIQELINDLRVQLNSSTLFEEDHKARLLKRLERLQAEMHKRVSDLDRFWGLIGDAGVVLGKFGNDAKPIVDRIKEIADIVWRTQSRAEELPSNTPSPLLGNDAKND